MNPSESNHPRWTLMRDVLRFQAKLLIDGLRDLLMSPVSLLAALAGLIFEPHDSSRYFNRLKRFGHRTERWINLFGTYDEVRAEPGVDELFGMLEKRLVDQYERGGATASAKRAVDKSFDGLHRGLDRVRERLLETSPPPATDQPPEEPDRS